MCVLSEREITHSEVIVHARVVGGLQMVDGGEADDKIIGVLENDLIWGQRARDLGPAAGADRAAGTLFPDLQAGAGPSRKGQHRTGIRAGACNAGGARRRWQIIRRSSSKEITTICRGRGNLIGWHLNITRSFPMKPALLVIDVQKEFFKANAKRRNR